MDYLNFDLRVSAGNNLTYTVSVIQSPAGEASAFLQPAFGAPMFQQSLLTLENVRGTSRGALTAGTSEKNVASVAPNTNELVIAQNVGRVLFESLFQSEVLSCYRSSLSTARDQQKYLRIRLRVDAPELSTLPWEFLYDDAEGDHINLLRATPLIRYLDMGRSSAYLPIQMPIRILGMIASPSDQFALDAEQERKRMTEAIDHLIESRKVELVWVQGQTWRDLAQAMQAGEWHIFHFIGHGGFDPDLGEGLLALVDEQDGSTNYLSATQLGRLFAGHPSMRLAVLNACEGAKASDNSVFSSTGAVLARRGIPAVVSMQFAITDRAAIEFSRTFYDSLAGGLPIDGCVQEARVAISMALGNNAEWGTPVLYMRASDGDLFHVDLAGAIFRRSAESPTPVVSSPKPTPQPKGQYSTTRPPGVENRGGLNILLRKVKQYWIDGLLEKSTYQGVLIDMSMALMQDAVTNPWADDFSTGLLEQPSAESRQLIVGQKIEDIFDAEGGSLLILGEPGSGKTIALLNLARDLLIRAESDPLRPVPVVFNLSTWTRSYNTFADWLIDELSARYQIPKKIGQSWLTESYFLPLLDGLDELGVEYRAACVEAINYFALETGLVGTVVCCRLSEYIDLPVRLSLNAAVCLQGLDDEQVQRYLAAAGAPLDGLRSVLQRDSALRIEARSPLMLTLMCQAYRDLPADQLASEGAESVAARRKQLMDAYVARMFGRSLPGRKQ